MLLIHGFAVLRISIPGPTQKVMSSLVMCTVANVISLRQDGVSLCPGSGVFKTFTVKVLFHAIIDTGKKIFSKHFL